MNTKHEYKILFDSGKVRVMEKQANILGKEGWRAISIGGGDPGYTFVLMERAIT